MKDSTRRIVLFVIVVVAGSILVLFDIPALFMIAGIIALAVLVLFINGSIHLPKISLKRKPGPEKNSTTSRASTVADTKKTGKKSFFQPGKPKKDNTLPSSSPSGQKSRLGLFKESLSTMSRAFSVLASDIGKARKSDTTRKLQNKKLDQMLDGSVQGKISDIRSLKEANPDIIPVERKTVEDPFTSLVKEPMNTELLDSGKSDVDINLLSDINLGSEMGEISFGEDISKLDVALDAEEEHITIDNESDDEVASILAAHQDELGTPDAKGGEVLRVESEINGLEGLDIGNIDLDEELDLGDEQDEPIKPVISQPPAATPSKPAPQAPAATEKPKAMADSMIAFSSGKGMDDDLMSSLKSEVSKTKSESHASLIRDLKDAKVPVQDLEKELEGVLSFRSKK
jgi:hypothetical protein